MTDTDHNKFQAAYLIIVKLKKNFVFIFLLVPKSNPKTIKMEAAMDSKILQHILFNCISVL